MSTYVIVAKLPKCDFNCDKDARYDFKTKHGPWAHGCTEHWINNRLYEQTGTGKGQYLVVKGERCPQFHWQYRCLMEVGHEGAHHTRGDDGTRYVWADLVKGQTIANETWRRGFLHLTVDADGMVSLWDDTMVVDSYLKLELTVEQVSLIEATRKKGGHTP